MLITQRTHLEQASGEALVTGKYWTVLLPAAVGKLPLACLPESICGKAQRLAVNCLDELVIDTDLLDPRSVAKAH